MIYMNMDNRFVACCIYVVEWKGLNERIPFLRDEKLTVYIPGMPFRNNPAL
jgi:hypothetical protein